MKFAARLLAAALACALANGPLLAQAQPLENHRAERAAELAEQLFLLAGGEALVSEIAARSAAFADDLAGLYLPEGSGPDWRAEVAAIHNPARVSALIHEALMRSPAINRSLTPELLRGLSRGAAQNVSRGGAGYGIEAAAWAALAHPQRWRFAQQRFDLAERLGQGEPAAIARLIAATDLVEPALARTLNRELAFARGFAAAGGFAFPTSPDDIAADLAAQEPERRAALSRQIEVTLYAAFAPLGEAAIDRIAAWRSAPEERALRRVLDQAAGEVLEQLAEETGRAAAKRLRGDVL